MTDLMTVEVSGALVDWALRGMVLLTAAGLLTVALRRGSAATRHLVWSLALVGVLAVPALRPALPTLEIPVLDAPPGLSDPVPAPGPALGGVRDAGGDAAAMSPASVRSSGPMSATSESAEVSSASASSGASASVSASVPGTGAGPASTTTPSSEAAPITPLAAVWLLGVIGFLLPLAAGRIELARLSRRCHRLESPRIRNRATRLALRLGMERPYRLLEGPAGSMPLTFGLFRPAIVLPVDATDWSRARLDAVLLHELAHVARRDTATQLLADVVRALHWFNPLAWVAARRLRIEREHACDDMALAAGSRPSQYADELLGLVRSYGLTAPTASAALAMARRGEVSTRLRAVLDEGRSRGRPSGAAAWSLGLLAVLVVSASAVATPVPAHASGHVPAQERTSPQVTTPMPVFGGGSDAAPAGDPANTSDPADAGDPADASDPTAPRELAGPAVVGAGSVFQGASCLADGDSWNSMSNQSRNDRKTIRMRRPGCDFELRMEGEIEFDAYAMQIRAMEPGSRLQIEESSRGTDHSVDIRPDGSGQPVVTYERDGRDHPFDSGARAWFALALQELFRGTGFLASERVEALLEVGGVQAVLTELGEIDQSHVFASYTEALMEQERLDEATLRALVRSSGRRVDSDHYLSGILEAVATHQSLQGGLLDDYLAASAELDSDHYITGSLRAALDSGQLSDSQVERVLEAAGTMDSDHYRSEILTGIADRYALKPAFRRAYMRATAEMDSDHYRSEVLGRLLDRSDLAAAERAGVLRAATMMDSDHYRSELLMKVGRAGLAQAELQRAFFEGAAGLDSDHYYTQTMALLIDQEVEPELLARIVEATTREVDSDHYLSELLLRILERHPVEGALRDTFMDAMDSLDSRHYRGRVAEALLRRSS